MSYLGCDCIEAERSCSTGAPRPILDNIDVTIDFLTLCNWSCFFKSDSALGGAFLATSLVGRSNQVELDLFILKQVNNGHLGGFSDTAICIFEAGNKVWYVGPKEETMVSYHLTQAY